MNSEKPRLRRPNASTVLAGIAVFAALGGSAYAGGLIGSSEIENNSVTSRDVKNKSLKKKDLTPKTVNALQGQQGPAGPAGPAGVVAPQSATVATINIPGGQVPTPIISKSVPAGNYVVFVRAEMQATEPGATLDVPCELRAGPTVLDQATWPGSAAPNAIDQIVLQGVGAAGADASLSVICTAKAAVRADNVSLIAIPTA